MEKRYRYITFEDRKQIARLWAIGTPAQAIAEEIGANPATISRELRRGYTGKNGRKLHDSVCDNQIIAFSPVLPRACSFFTSHTFYRRFSLFYQFFLVFKCDYYRQHRIIRQERFAADFTSEKGVKMQESFVDFKFEQRISGVKDAINRRRRYCAVLPISAGGPTCGRSRRTALLCVPFWEIAPFHFPILLLQLHWGCLSTIFSSF